MIVYRQKNYTKEDSDKHAQTTDKQADYNKIHWVCQRVDARHVSADAKNVSGSIVGHDDGKICTGFADRQIRHLDCSKQFSCQAQAVLSWTAIQTLVKELGHKGLWLFVRGFDNWPFFQFRHNLKLRFLSRINSKRNVLTGLYKRPYSISSLVKRMSFDEKIVWGHKSKPYILSVGCTEIIIPGVHTKLLLIAVYGFGRQPMLLVTNDLSSTHTLRFFVCSYLKRWGGEVSGRFLKQIFKLEHIRLLTFRGLVNLIWLAMWCFGFLATLYFSARKTFARLASSVPSFDAVPAFCYYRLAHALSVLLTRYGPFAKINYSPCSNFG